MKATLNVMKRLAKNIENTMCLCASNVRIYNGCMGVESIIRFEEGNGVTISGYLMEDEFLICYLLEDGTYKRYGSYMMDAFKDVSEFMFFIGIKFYETEQFISTLL